MPKDRDAFRERFLRWRLTGELPYEAGRPKHYEDGTEGAGTFLQKSTNSVIAALRLAKQQQPPAYAPSGKYGINGQLYLDWKDYTEANAAAVQAAANQPQFRTDTRTTAERRLLQQQAAVERERYRKQQQKEKAQEGFETLMSLTSPSTYVSQAIGLPVPVPIALAIDGLVYGAAGALKSGVKAAAKAYARRGFNTLNTPTGLLSDEPLIARGTNSINLTKPENNIINSLSEEAPIPYLELQTFKNSVLERMADARGITDPVLRKNFILDGMSKVGTKYNRSSVLNNSLAEGTTDMATGTINIRPGSEEFALGHEMRHRLDYARVWDGSEKFTLTPEEYGTLRKAYTSEFLDYPVEYPMQLEMVTTNADVRRQLLGKQALRDLSVAEQNAKIDAATGTDVLNALKNANDYGNYYYRALLTNPIYRENNAQLMINILKNIKAATKLVGGFSIPAALSLPQLNK